MRVIEERDRAMMLVYKNADIAQRALENAERIDSADRERRSNS